MITKEMKSALNSQVNKELYSAYLYLAMSAHSEATGLRGFANWFNVQVKEELTHAEKFYNYLNQQGIRVKLSAIGAPPAEFKGPLHLFQTTLAHERKVTKSIHALVDLARGSKDHAAEAMLQWFVTEQVEEEANADEVVQKLRLTGNDGNGILLIDSQLAARVFVPPAPVA